MKPAIIVIDRRCIFSECLCDFLSANLPETQVLTVRTAWHAAELSFLPVACILVAESADIEPMHRAFPAAPLLLICDSREGETPEPHVPRLMLDMPRAIFAEIVRNATQRGCAGALGSGSVPASNGNDHEPASCATAGPACKAHSNPREHNGSRTRPIELSDRESEVLTALTRGLPNKLIADEMHLSENTVKIHVRNVMRKLGVTNRTMAALYEIGGLGDTVRRASPGH